jgi:arylsulfatase A-like enzyme/multidrug resistance efflux pump
MKVVFVSMDTVRADRVFGPARRPGLTPNLDRLAGEGASFTNAFATDIPTTPSHTALFTGRFGVDTGIVSHFHPGSNLAADAQWLPSIFHQAGYRTGAVDHLFAMKNWFIRGYDDYMSPPGRSRSPGSVINNMAFPWLADHVEQDLFLFLHFWDAHIPYVPSSPFRELFTADSAGRLDPLTEQELRSRPTYPLFKRNHYDHLDSIPNLEYLADLYDAEIACLDHEIGRLFDQLVSLGIVEETIVVLFGDHGENMVEHDHWFDHAGLYDSVVHVPLMIWAPGRLPQVQVEATVALVDVMPTVLDLSGLPTPNGIAGRSLLPVVNGLTTKHRLEVPLSECTWQAKRGLRTGDWKFIRSYHPGVYPRAEDELYDLHEDPDEQDNVAAQHPDVVQALSTRLDTWLAEQLGSRSDPMLAVIADGLPAVERLDGMINGPDIAAPPAAALVPLASHALAPNGRTSAPVARPRGRARRARRRLVLATAALLLAAVPFGVVVNSVFFDSPVSAAGAVEPLHTAELDFSATGTVASIDVTQGQQVQQGAVLATQDASAADAKLASDQAKLGSDQAALTQLGTPLTPAQVLQSQDKVNEAQAAVSAAQSTVADVTAVNNASLGAPLAAVQAAQATLATDQQTYRTTCSPPTPPNQTACSTDAHQLTVDQNALGSAQANQAEVTAMNLEKIDQARTALSQAQAALASAQSDQAVASQPATPAAIAAAQAAVTSDKAAVTSDQAAVAQTVLRAPFTGVVGSVAGAVGDVASAQGVRQPSPSQPVTQPTSSGIEIFPQQSQPQAPQQQQYAPLITFDSPDAKVVAQVSETDIGSVHNGQHAVVTMPAVPGSTFTATVQQIEPTAVDVSGSTYYLVDLVVSSPRDVSTKQPRPVVAAASGGERALDAAHDPIAVPKHSSGLPFTLYAAHGRGKSSAPLVGLSAEVTF